MSLTEILVVCGIIILLGSMTLVVVDLAMEKGEYSNWVAYKSSLSKDPACYIYLDFEEGPGDILPQNIGQCTNFKRYKSSSHNARQIVNGTGPFVVDYNSPTWVTDPDIRRWKHKDAMYFKNSGMYIRNSEATRYTKEITILTWIKITKFSSTKYIVDKWWWAGSPDRRSWGLCFSSGNLRFYTSNNGIAQTYINWDYDNIYPANDPQWVHVAATYDGTNMKLYVDSELVGTKAQSSIFPSRKPVLIGTCSVEESEQVSLLLEKNAIPHQVLNAKQDQHEAEIIARAGQQGMITVATNMAGRGTDIALGPGVKEKGGLHVIALSRNDSARIDRQLYGRCARQGDPGSAEAILSLEDPALVHFYSSAMLNVLAKLAPGNRPVPESISRLILRLPQQKNEQEQRRIRKQLMKQDQHLRRVLAFSGKFE